MKKGVIFMEDNADMEPKVRQAYLYDFYGELLKEHQRAVFEDFVFHDLSLGEIAEERGISRQAVHDLVKRATKKLEEYERKLQLMARFLKLRGKAERIRECADGFEAGGERRFLEEIRRICAEIVEDL